MIVAVDFDGTCVEDRFPFIGKNIGAIPVLKKLVHAGHKIILYTMRSNRDVKKAVLDKAILNVTGNFLEEAIDWFRKNEIPLYGVQRNPTQDSWTTSPKCYAQLYIDDAALGCPLIYPENGDKAYADWGKIEEYLIKEKIIL